MKVNKMKEKFIVESLPGDNGNAYSASKAIYNAIKVEPEKVIMSSNDEVNEAVDFEFDNDQRGGVIILSTDVNAIDLSENEVVNKIKQVVVTLGNRLFATSKIDKVAQNNELVGWTIGKFLNGRYTSKRGVPYGENSLSVEVVGIDHNTLIKIASELCGEFKQEDVMVKDYTTGGIYFVNDEE